MIDLIWSPQRIASVDSFKAEVFGSKFSQNSIGPFLILFFKQRDIQNTFFNNKKHIIQFCIKSYYYIMYILFYYYSIISVIKFTYITLYNYWLVLLCVYNLNRKHFTLYSIKSLHKYIITSHRYFVAYYTMCPALHIVLKKVFVFNLLVFCDFSNPVFSVMDFALEINRTIAISIDRNRMPGRESSL